MNSPTSLSGRWIHAIGCSLLVSMASLICLVILPIIFVQGKPSKAVVHSLTLFGAVQLNKFDYRLSSRLDTGCKSLDAELTIMP
ncbi:IAA-alanine resistance protein 1 [Camellia lanceoleosa]|uniref:IAA-alanine resistance protein 1 n=1 Tax=Camellia lanceoleosa TaxID=1840588 RepID=A0ACC0ISW3_9ERIC|nr:IAA-alanine resistance protein 1 [Camellia lanceoleosa]